MEIIKKTAEIYVCPLCGYESNYLENVTRDFARCERHAKIKSLRQVCTHGNCRYFLDEDALIDNDDVPPTFLLYKSCIDCGYEIQANLNNLDSFKLEQIWKLVESFNE